MDHDVIFEHLIGSNRLWYAKQKGWCKHFHYPAELIIPLNGDFILIVNDVEYTIKENECGIVFPYQLHEIKHISCEESIVVFAEPGLHPSFQKYLTAYLPVSNHVEKKYIPDWIPDLARNFRRTSSKGEYNDYVESCFSASHEGLGMLIYNEILSRIPLVKADEKRDLKSLNSLINWCNQHYTEQITLEDAARELYLSKSTISHMMASDLRLSFTRYVNSLRAGRACELLKNSDRKIGDIAFESGFGSLWSFNRNFMELVGMTPGDYRASGNARK